MRSTRLLILFALLIGCLSFADDIKSRALPPVKLNGKAFFPIGVYDLAKSTTPGNARLGDIDTELYDCGVNIAFFGHLGMPDNKMYPGYSHIVKAYEKAKADPRFADIALIVNIAGDLFCVEDNELNGKAKRKYRPLKADELKSRKAFLAEAMKTLSKYPNIIGYSFDEPENTFTNYFQIYRKEENIDSGIGKALKEWMGWMKVVAKENHPSAQWLPIIAWWGTYKDVASLYDVIIADQYMRGGDGTEFSSPLYEVSFDAARMVTAARMAGGGRSAIYMPQCYDRLGGNWTVLTRAEQRYVLFAPVTRGAMGIIAWRLNRASQKYRDEVVYPSVRELSRYKDFFLGEWHDDLVKSSHDKASVDYLKKFVVRDKLLPDDDENGGVVEVEDFVPDVSYCLRKCADGRWLLLAVNNRREKIKVDFTLSLPFKPQSMVESIDNRSVAIGNDGKFSDEFTPFAVHAYIIKD